MQDPTQLAERAEELPDAAKEKIESMREKLGEAGARAKELEAMRAEQVALLRDLRSRAESFIEGLGTALGFENPYVKDGSIYEVPQEEPETQDVPLEEASSTEIGVDPEKEDRSPEEQAMADIESLSG